MVVCGWLLVPKTGRLRMARGRPRMACGRLRMAEVSQTSRRRMARSHLRMAMVQGSPFKPSTDGGRTRSEAGRAAMYHVHQNGCEGRLLQVVHGWPTGRPRIAQLVHVPAVSCRELTGTTALKAWSHFLGRASCAGFTGACCGGHSRDTTACRSWRYR